MKDFGELTGNWLMAGSTKKRTVNIVQEDERKKLITGL